MKTLLALVALVAVIGIAGTMDYQDELKEADHYAAMVCSEAWPNYKGVEVECSEHRNLVITTYGIEAKENKK